MIRALLSCRALLAVLLVLGLASPPEAMPIAPAWLLSSICTPESGHAPGGHGQPGTAAHMHCALCLAGMALFPPPLPVALPAPRGVAVLLPSALPAAWGGPGADHPYASRAPPRIA